MLRGFCCWAGALLTAFAVVEGPAAVVNQGGTPNSPDNPARKGAIVMLFATGFGSLEPQPADGAVIGLEEPFLAPIELPDG